MLYGNFLIPENYHSGQPMQYLKWTSQTDIVMSNRLLKHCWLRDSWLGFQEILRSALLINVLLTIDHRNESDANKCFPKTLNLSIKLWRVTHLSQLQVCAGRVDWIWLYLLILLPQWPKQDGTSVFAGMMNDEFLLIYIQHMQYQPNWRYALPKHARKMFCMIFYSYLIFTNHCQSSIFAHYTLLLQFLSQYIDKDWSKLF